MADKKGKNILGKSNNFHRKTYKQLLEKGIIKDDMGPTKQKEILDSFYKGIGIEAKAFELDQIYDIGIKLIKNERENEQGKRKIFTEKEKEIKKDFDKNDELAAANKSRKRSVRNNNRSFNKKYENWKAEKGYDANRNNELEVNIINEYLKYLKEEKGYKDSTIDNYRQAIHTEQEDIFRKGAKLAKQQVKNERYFTKLTQKRRIPVKVSPENMENFIKLSNHSNNIFIESKTKGRKSDSDKLQNMIVFDTYLAEYKGYQDHNQVKIEDVEDFFKWLKSDKEVDGKIIEGLVDKRCNAYKTALNQYSKKGEWDIADSLNKIPGKDLGIGKVHKKVVERAMTMAELDKALTLAFEGTTKHKANPNYFVGYSILLDAGAGLRSDETINLTLKQLKYMLKDNEAILELVKTKGNVPRNLTDDVLKFNDVLLKHCKNLITLAEEKGLKETDKPLIELFPKNKARAEAGKTHLIKGEVNSWFKNHRDKFQDEDRISNKEIAKINSGIKNKDDVEIKKGNLSPHSCRHTFASLLFNTYKNAFDEQFANDYRFRQKMYNEYKKERTRDNKKFNPNPNKMDYYMQRGLYIHTCKEVSKLLGHGRYEITETYIVAKDKDKKKYTAFDLKNFKQFELGVDSDGNFYAQKEIE